MNTGSIEIEIRLSFVSNLLTSVEVSVTDLKGSCYRWNFEHPILQFLRIIKEQANLSKLCTANYPFLTDGSPSDETSNIEIVELPSEETNSTSVIQILNKAHSNEFGNLLESICEGLQIHPPELCDEGVNGTYFLKDKNGKYRGVFKPNDEEVDSANNPKADSVEDQNKLSHRGLVPGEASLREVAAYMLDRDGFFGVPKTSLIKLNHSSFKTEKIGSLQEFIENDGATWDVGPAMFPKNQVHKIGILDLYILNTDRHGGNILFIEDDEMQLIPIDNGFSLPDTVNIPSLWFEWMTWPQAKKPFDPITIDYIKNINIESDIALLRKELGIREECLRVMKVMGTLLKKCVTNGWSLHEIGRLVCPPRPGEPSELHVMWQEAMNQSGWNPDLPDHDFLNCLYAQMDTLF